MSARSTEARTGPLHAVALLTGMYVVAAVALLLAVVSFLPLVFSLVGQVNFLLKLLFQMIAIGSVRGLMLIYFCVFQPRRRNDGPWAAVAVSREDAPGLWAIVDEVAEVVGVRAPTRLRVAAMANATVSEEARLFGLAAGPRSLDVGLPLLLGMSTGELKAALAHEMGHYARGHTRLGPQVYQGSIALRNASEVLKLSLDSAHRGRFLRWCWMISSLHTRLVSRIFSAYSSYYDRVSFPARRAQELVADGYAADAFGREATAGELRAAYALQAAWDEFHNGYLEPMRRAGHTPDDPFAVFADMLNDPDFRDVLAELKQSPPELPTSPDDSHPPIAERLKVLEERGGEGPTDADTLVAPAVELLTEDQRASIAGALNGGMLPSHEKLAGMPWRDWIRLAAGLRATALAASLLRAVAADVLPGTAAPTLLTVLDLLEAGRGGDIATALASDCASPAQSEAEAEHLLCVALFALVGQYLVEAGRAQWILSWTGPSRLIAADITAEELRDLLDAAVTHPATEASRLRLHLAALSLDTAAEPGPWKADADKSTDVGAIRAMGDGSLRIKPVVDTRVADRLWALRAMTALVMVVCVTVALIGNHAPGSSPDYVPNGALPTSDYGDPAPIPSANEYPPSAPLTGLSAPQTTQPIPIQSWIQWYANQPPQPSATPVKLADGSMTSAFDIVLKPGDTLTALACRHGTTVAVLQYINKLGTSTRIVAGAKLLVPVGHPYISGC